LISERTQSPDQKILNANKGSILESLCLKKHEAGVHLREIQEIWINGSIAEGAKLLVARIAFESTKKATGE
jgi:hypothetical protein